MYKEIIKVKGTGLTVKEFKEKADATGIYETGFFNDFFEDEDENKTVLEALGGSFSDEKDGYTIILAEEA